MRSLTREQVLPYVSATVGRALRAWLVAQQQRSVPSPRGYFTLPSSNVVHTPSSCTQQHCTLRLGLLQCTLLHVRACCAACVADVVDVLCVLQDLPGALSDAQVAEALGLADIRNRDWAIFKTSAIKGDGLFEGLDWLANTLKARGR
jgi:hypothetical protein